MASESSESKAGSEQQRKSSRLAVVAFVISCAALLCSGAQAYYSWLSSRAPMDASATLSDDEDAMRRERNETDPRTRVTLAELAKRAPSIRTGNLQAWWAGEQARQVQRLEAQAKRQTLAGDREGAARSVSRADAVRSGIPTLADFEKPPAR